MRSLQPKYLERNEIQAKLMDDMFKKCLQWLEATSWYRWGRTPTYKTYNDFKCGSELNDWGSDPIRSL